MTCRICGSTAVSPLFPFREYAVARCQGCGTAFLEPQPSDATLAEIYTSDYFFARDGDAERERHEGLKRASAQRTLALLPPPAVNAKLLDVGCGTGDFLIEAQARGYEVTGIEFSPSSKATAAARVQGTVLQGSLESVALPSETFDIVAATDVIEHVRDPVAFAREVRRVLKPGGRTLITAPSRDSWSARLQGRRWVEYKVEHLYYFDSRSLERLMRSVGFASVEIRSNVKILSVDYIAAHFGKFQRDQGGSIIQALAKMLPAPIRYRPFPIVASGITVIAA